jgi:hypothetical protein
MQQDRLIELYIRDYCSPIYPPDLDSLRYFIKNPEWNCLSSNVFQSIEVTGSVIESDIILGFWHGSHYHQQFEIQISQVDRRLAKIKWELQDAAKRGSRFLLLDHLINFWKQEREEFQLEQGEEMLFNWGMRQIENFIDDRPIVNINQTAMTHPNQLGCVEKVICEVLESKTIYK